MLLRHIVISCSDLSSSSLFYIGVLELDCIDSSEHSLELSDGIVLADRYEYERLTNSSSDERRGRNITLEFEIPSFDKFLYKLYKNEFCLDYQIYVDHGQRVIKLHDPDRNIILIKESIIRNKTVTFESSECGNSYSYSSAIFLSGKK